MSAMTIKKSFKVLAIAALFLAPLTASAALGPIKPAEKIPEPYTNETCLKNCHGEEGFAGVDDRGRERSAFVDKGEYLLSVHGKVGIWCIDCHQGADPNGHPRSGYADVDCRACHSEKPPEGVFPPNGLETLKARLIEPPKKEALKGEGWTKTLHGEAFLSGDPRAPFCPDCHTAHTIRRSADPSSSVNGGNLAATCGGCHDAKVDEGTVGGYLTRFRISAHGKGDLRSRYSVTECISCHQGAGAHGEEAITAVACPTCHDPAGKIAEGRSGVFHIDPADSEQRVAGIMKWVYTAGFWGGMAGAIVVVLFIFICARSRRDGEE